MTVIPAYLQEPKLSATRFERVAKDHADVTVRLHGFPENITELER